MHIAGNADHGVHYGIFRIMGIEKDPVRCPVHELSGQQPHILQCLIAVRKVFVRGINTQAALDQKHEMLRSV